MMFKKFSVFLLALFMVFSGFTPVGRAAGWTGKWIWQSADGPNNTFISFRKVVNLSAKPASAIANIAVENEYWLYVNGTLVVKEGGLQCRPDLTNTYYDTVDISAYLQSGSNTIAVLAWYKGGNDAYSQKMKNKGGFFFECDVTGASPAKIISDSTWKMKVNPAFNATAQMTQWDAYKWVAYPISYDARNETANWYAASYNDSSWANAVEKGTPPAAPWNDLKPRTIPLWKDYGLISYSNLTFPMTITSSGPSQVYTVDGGLGANIQGTAYMRINAPAGVKVKMTMNDFYSVEYITKAGVQEFDSIAWQNTDHLLARYEFSNIPSGQSVEILDLKFHQTSYNTNIIGSFSSSDGSLNSLWTKCKNTSFVCMRDYFLDCPNRERGQWWGDVSEQILYSFYLYDSSANLLAKKGFRELFNSQKADGSLYTTAPGDVFNLPDQNLAAVISLWDYYIYTGDSALIAELYPNVKKFISHVAGCRNSDGMVIQQAGPWNWIDWGSNMDNQDGSANTVVNALFYNLLDAAKNMANISGNTGDVAAYQGYQDAIRNKFNTYFWSSSKNAYVYNWKNGVQSSVSDDRSNAWAALAGMVDSAKVNGVVNVLEKQYNCSPYQERYVEDALFKIGADAQAISRMRNRHIDMVNSWSTTLWEEFPANNSNNHAWSAGPLYLLDSYVLGIKPTSAAYSQFKYEPHLGGLTSISATVPTARGNITASISNTGTQYTQNLSLPSNTTAVLSIPKNAFASSSGVIDTIKAGGTVIYQLGAYKGGVSGITFNSEDSSYIRFNVNSGSWSFAAAMTSSGAPAGYTYCAEESGRFTLPGTCDVAYGANGQFLYKTGQTGTITFNNTAFGGDPIANVAKRGYYKPVNDGPAWYTYCANENGTFILPGTCDIAYGANGQFLYKTGQSGTITFSNNTFGGDPIQGTAKKGYYKVTSGAPAGYTECAGENGSYTLNGACDVAYGANGQFYYKYGQTGTIAFSNTAFGGDPIANVVKKGYYKPIGAVFYQNADYGGTAVTLPKGRYTMAQLNASGIPNDWVSSLRVPAGWTVEIYQDNNFAGTKWAYTADTAYVGAAANDQATSVIIY